MKPRASHFLSGMFLVLVGVLFLLRTLGYVWFDEEYTVAVVFFSAGVVLLLAYYVFHKRLWTLILGAIGVFVGAAVFVDESRVLPNEAIGIFFFVITGLVFLDALRQGKRNWWALIPGGFCLIFAAHILLDMSWWLPGEYHGVIFFGGVGLIFGIIYLLKDKTLKLDWAKYPSLISFLLALLVMLTVDFRDRFNRFVFPVILIAVGIFVLVKSLQKPGQPGAKKKGASDAQKEISETFPQGNSGIDEE